MKNQYQSDLENRIASLENNYQYMRMKVDELDRDTDLEAKLKRARAKLDELKGRGEDKWEDVKAKADEAWKDVETTFERLKARLTQD